MPERNAVFRDVNSYPADVLQRRAQGVEVFVTYHKVWDDGFGAKGWKINASIGDPTIIASTRQTGERINTSVFVHDILDHLISGFGISGHRSEAMALMQLARRTGSDPRHDFEQLVREDLMRGRVNGESLRSFLPEELLALLPPDQDLSDRQAIAYLEDALGEAALVEALVDQFFALGKMGAHHARLSWNKLGLDAGNATNTGLALQALLEKVDTEVEASGIERLDASFILSREDCVFVSEKAEPQSIYHMPVAA